ncbi:MAG: NAD(P)-binding domain-containing protein [Planctomycetes bacterium]|nr:NAD(P)-binding domain-containing protein [Planctomycetota bacterium]
MGRLGQILDWEIALTQKSGTRHGRQMPDLDEAHQTSVKGIYAVGDLADAPVIKISLNQGYETLQTHIAPELKAEGKTPAGAVDVVIVGCGPAGIGAGLRCMEEGLSFVILEKEKPFNTIQNYPKHKHVFVEPVGIKLKAPLWLKDALKEDLIAQWEEGLREHEAGSHEGANCLWCRLKQPAEVKAIVKEGESGLFRVEASVGTFKARRVILAIGRRGTPRKIGCPGETNERVRYALKDAEEHRGKRVLVVGGGDSAIEAALALSETAAETSISYRQEGFFRCKAKNRELIEAKITAGRIKAHYNSSIKSIGPNEVVIGVKDGAVTIPNDHTFALLGADLPTDFLKKIGVRMEGTWTVKRAMWLAFSFLLVYSIYAMKSYPPMWPFNHFGEWFAGLAKGTSEAMYWAPHAITFKATLPWGEREFGPSFYYSLLYTSIMWFFGIQAIRKYPSKYQKLRYSSLIFFQTAFFFLIPEFFAPWLFKLANWGNEAWRTYGLAYPWPLSSYSIRTYDVQNSAVHRFFFFWAVAGALVLIPVYVRWGGKSFCTWICGCGGLAETLGDRWRHLAPKGPVAKKYEWMGYVVLAFAGVLGLLVVNDVWHFVGISTFHDTTTFAKGWYDLIVDFWLIAVIPVALYPFFGGKIWCRYWCPLAKYMQILSAWYGNAHITANDHCIGCGQCSRYCQVGIDVQSFAQKRERLDNTNSCCIQCGICVQVCPMDVLKFGPQPATPGPNMMYKPLSSSAPVGTAAHEPTKM